MPGKTITFDGTGSSGSAIHATKDRDKTPFHLNLNGVHFKNCKSDNGGAISIDGAVEVKINHCIFENCQADAGAAIFTSGITEIKDCTFTNCQAREGSLVFVSDLKSNQSETLFDGKNCKVVNEKESNGSLFALGGESSDRAQLILKDTTLDFDSEKDVIEIKAGSLSYQGSCKIEGITQISRNGFVKIEESLWPENRQSYHISNKTEFTKAFEGTSLETLREKADLSGNEIDEKSSSDGNIYVNPSGKNTITYMAEGRAIENQDWPKEYEPGEILSLPESLSNSTRPFVGWYDNPDFTGSFLYYFQSSKEGGPLTFYARFSDARACNHLWSKEKIYQMDPTCAYPGLAFTTQTCSLCQAERYEEEILSRTSHVFTGEKKLVSEIQPGCLTTGQKVYQQKCEYCSQVVESTETIPATGHDFSDWSVTKEPTTSEYGSKTRTCKTCGHQETETIEKLPSGTTTGGGSGGGGSAGSGGSGSGGGGSSSGGGSASGGSSGSGGSSAGGSGGGSGSGGSGGGASGGSQGQDQEQDAQQPSDEQNPEEKPQSPSTEIIENSDGSKTEKTTDPQTGTITTKTEKVDGSVETTIESASGEKSTQTKAANGTTTLVKEDTNGFKEASVSLSTSAIEQSQSGNITQVGMPAIPADHLDNKIAISIALPEAGIEKTSISIPVINAKPGSVAMIEDGQGNLTPIPSSLIKDGKLIVPLAGSAKIVIKDNAKFFKDVTTPVEDYPANGIAFLSAREIMTGVGTGEYFDLHGVVTRGQLATILYRYHGSPDTTALALPAGVNVQDYFAGASKWAVSTGLMGVGSEFNGGRELTREQLALILFRLEDQPDVNLNVLESYQDQDRLSSLEMRKAAAWAVEKKIMGQGNPKLSPAASSQRQDLAAMVSRYLQQK